MSLLRLFTNLYIPNTVWQEATSSGRVSPAELQALPNIRRCDLSPEGVTQFARGNSLTHLHAGECESLYVCIEDKVSLLLTDDLAVRDAAKSLGLTPVGSLGVIVSAYRVRMITIPVAEQYIFDLQDISSLFVTRAIVELALESIS